jgi:hypothetical protein
MSSSDPIQPKPLSGWAAAEKKRLEAGEKLKIKSATVPQGGALGGGGFAYTDKSYEEALKKDREIEYQRAVQTSEKARIDSKPIVQYIGDTLLNDKVFNQLITKDADGYDIVNEGVLRNKLYAKVAEMGGDELLSNMILPEIKGRADSALKAPRVEKRVEKNMAAYGAKIEEFDKKLAGSIARANGIVKNGYKTIQNNLKADLDKGFTDIQAKYQPAAIDVLSQYEMARMQLKNELTSDVISQSQFEIDQKAEQLERDVANGTMPQVAQIQMNQFVEEMRKRNEQLLSGPEFNARLDTEFQEKYGTVLKAELEDLNEAFKQEYNEYRKGAIKLAKKKADMVKSFGDDALEEIKGIAAGVHEDSIAVLQKAYGKAWDEITAEDDASRKRLTEAFFEASKINPLISAKFFGDSFGSNVGNAMKGFGYALNSAGFEGEFTRWLKEGGGELVSQNFRYQPELKASQFLAPAFLGQLASQVAYSLPTIGAGLGLSAATGGGSLAVSLTALTGFLSEAGMESGLAYEEYLSEKPYDIEGANGVAKKVFLANAALLPLHAVAAKFWVSGAKTGLLKTGVSEFAQESMQSGISQAAIRPKSGNYALDALGYSFSKQAVEEGIMAAGSSLLTGGIAQMGSRVRSVLSVNTEPDAQHFAETIMERGPQYARALLAGPTFTDEERDAALATIDRVEASVSDARSAGLDKKQIMYYVSVTEKIAEEKAKLDGIQNQVLREKQEAKIKKLEDEVGKLIDGNTGVALIGTPMGSIAVEEKQAQKMLGSPVMQEAIQSGDVTVETDSRDIREVLVKTSSEPTVEPMDNPVLDTVMQNIDDVNPSTHVGKKLGEMLDNGESGEKITELVAVEVMADPTGAVAKFGPEIVAAVRLETAKQLRAAMVQQPTPQDSLQVAPETKVESGEVDGVSRTGNAPKGYDKFKLIENNGGYIRTGEKIIDDNYDDDDVESEREKAYRVSYNVNWVNVNESEEPIKETFNKIDDAIKDANIPGDYDSKYGSYLKTIEPVYTEVWLNKDGSVYDEGKEINGDELSYTRAGKEFIDTIGFGKFDSLSEIYAKDFGKRETSSEELLSEVISKLPTELVSLFNKENKNGFTIEHSGGNKYSYVKLFDKNGNEVDELQLRISDHRYNPSNNDDAAKSGKFISVEIANVNETKDKFNTNYSIEYSGENKYEDVLNGVLSRVNEIFSNTINLQETAKASTPEVPITGTKTAPPAISMNYMSNEEIIKTSNPVKVKREQAKIQKEMKQLESVLSCLTK